MHIHVTDEEFGAALGKRWRSMFASVHASEQLDHRIRVAVQTEAARKRRRSRIINFVWRLAPVAAVLVLAVTLMALDHFGHLGTAEHHAELLEIHRQNLSPGPEFYEAVDGNDLANHLRGKLGFQAAALHLDPGMSFRGCRVAHFREQSVGCYVVETGDSAISIVMLVDTPEALGLGGEVKRGGRVYLACTAGKCRIVARRMGSYTYVALGDDVSPMLLADVLERLATPDVARVRKSRPVPKIDHTAREEGSLAGFFGESGISGT